MSIQPQLQFNYEEFKNKAIADMKAGKTLFGQEGIFAPLMKEFLEAALEGEMDSHMVNITMVIFAALHVNKSLIIDNAIFN